MPGQPTNAGYAQTTLASVKGEGFLNQNSFVRQGKLPPPGVGIEPGFPSYEGYALPLGPHHVFYIIILH